MSTSLRIQHGDLALEGNALSSVSGAQKLLQDLRCTVLIPQGSIEVHPEYGSTLNDETASNIIGAPNNSRAAAAIQAEIRRICGNYQKQQIARNNADASTYGRLTVSPEETLLKIIDITATPVEDKVIVTVDIETGTGTIQAIVPLEGI